MYMYVTWLLDGLASYAEMSCHLKNEKGDKLKI